MNEALPEPQPAPPSHAMSLAEIDDVASRASYSGEPGTNYIDRHEVIKLCLIARSSVIMDRQVKDTIDAAEQALKGAMEAAQLAVEGHAEAVNYRRALKRMEAAVLQRQEWIETARRNADLTGRILHAYRALMNLVRTLRNTNPVLTPAEGRSAARDLFEFEEANRPDVGE